jgi:NAD(P)H-hydrate repair Nnr-like enzyme with NAD(P)H-hydrate dehydratase domain
MAARDQEIKQREAAAAGWHRWINARSIETKKEIEGRRGAWSGSEAAGGARSTCVELARESSQLVK